MRIFSDVFELTNRFWGGKMTEEQATEEGRYSTPQSESNLRLEFIRAKYFGRDLGVPELTWYTDIETPLDPSLEGPYPFDEEEEWDGEESEIVRNVGLLSLQKPVVKIKRMKRVVTRRISVSSSESEVDIKEVLKGVVRDYTATHSRSTRPA